jgi:hypothetical protein
LSHLEGAKAYSRPDDTEFRAAIKQSWSKLVEYYGKTELSSVHVAALVLDPRMKFAYLEPQWQPDWVADARNIMSTFCKTYQADDEMNFNPILESKDSIQMSQQSTKRSIVDIMNINTYCFGPDIMERDELGEYLNLPLVKLSNEENKKFDLIKW